LAVPMSIYLYTCMESALIISPFTAFASAMESSVFPTAVGPVSIIKGSFFISASILFV